MSLAKSLAKEVDVAGDVIGADVGQQLGRILLAGGVEGSCLPKRQLEGRCRRWATERAGDRPAVLGVVPAFQLPAQPHPSCVEAEDVEAFAQLDR